MSLIDPPWMKKIHVLLGAWFTPRDMNTDNFHYGGLKWNRAKFVHVYEEREGYHNDIAILTLTDQVTFSPKISPICLPDDDIQVFCPSDQVFKSVLVFLCRQ